MKQVTAFLSYLASTVVAWLQRWFAPASPTLPALCHSGAYGIASTHTPAMLVASDMRGRVSFFVPEL